MKLKPEHLAAIALILIGASGIFSQPRASNAVATVSFPIVPPTNPQPGRDYPHTIMYVVNYSDLITQLALQPNSQLDPPPPKALSSAMDVVIDQTLLGHAVLSDAEIRNAWPTQSENQTMVAEMASVFPSRTEFENRLAKANVGPSDSPRFRIVLMYRWRVQRYIDRHFRSLANVTPEDEEKYYEHVFKPDFQRRYPGRLLPVLNEKRPEINRILTEQKVEAVLKDELDRLRSMATIRIKRFTTESVLLP